MKTSHLVGWTALILILASAIGGAWQASRTASAHRHAMAEAKQASARLRAELDRLQPPTAAVNSTPPATAGRPSAPPAPFPTTTRKTASAVGPRRGQGQVWIFPLIADPKLQALRLEADRATLATSYGVFFAAQGLDAAQRRRFIDLIVEHNAALHDIALIREAQNLANDDPALTQNREKIIRELRAAQTALLGETGFAALQTYDRTVSLRAWVHGMAGTLALVDSPLTPAQGEALVQALAQGQPRYQQGGVALLNQVEWVGFERAASAILTPAQLPMLYADIESATTDRFSYKLLLMLQDSMQQRAAQAGGKN